MSEQAFDLKGEMSLLNVLVLRTANLQVVSAALDEKLAKTGQVFQRSPVIVDCQLLGESIQELEVGGLKRLLQEKGLIPVGLRNFPAEMDELLAATDWPLLRPKAAVAATVNVDLEPTESTEATSPIPTQETAKAPLERLLLIERPVRSGQQVYCPEGDIVVMQQTSAGSELLAGGSVHVYGTLRGRVLAGIHGDVKARIFCQKLEAELIAIAGRYRLLDEIDSNLKGQAVMVYLQNEKLKIVPI